MAEAFARAHGSDVLEAQSAGLAPAIAVAPLTHLIMLEKDIDLGDFYPKEMGQIIDRAGGGVDLIINMSGYALQLKKPVPVEDWDVPDPIGEAEEVFREVRDEIERRVLRLIETLRSRKKVASEAAPTAARVDSRRRPPRQ
jgi:arsenate reductase (thioredoxin)